MSSGATKDAGPDAAARPPSVVAQVVERVSLIRREGRHEVSFRLDPPDLGAVRIEAVLEGPRLTLHIRVENEAAREMLAQAVPRLRESLAQHGLVAERVAVELGLDSFARQSPRDPLFQRPLLPEPVGPARRVAAASAHVREPSVDGVDLWV